MGIFQSTRSRSPDEVDVGSLLYYPNLQNEYKSTEDSSERRRSVKILVFLSSIYKAAKAILQKLCVVFNYLRPRKAADADPPHLPIQNPSPNAPLQRPLLLPPPQIWSSSSSSSKSSLSGLRGAIDDKVAVVPRFPIYSGRDHIVSVPEIRCSQLVIPPCLERKPSRKSREIVKRSIVEVEKEKRIKHYSSRHKILLVGEGDFSFSACLARALGSAANIIATSLDSQGKLLSIQPL